MPQKSFDPFAIARLIAKSRIQELSPGEQARLSEWLNARPGNQQLIKELENTSRLQQDVKVMDAAAPGKAWESLRRQLPELAEPGSGPASRPRGMIKYLAAAATLCLISLIGWWMFSGTTDPGIVQDTTGLYQNDVLPGSNKAQLILADGRVVELEQEHARFQGNDGVLFEWTEGRLHYKPESGVNDSPAMHTLRVPKGGTYQITLADGTRVWLNSESSVRFPSAFRGDTREIQLEGEAYFDVAHNKEKPFKIRARGSEIEVLGTEFNVNAYPQGVSATLVQGSVKLTAPGGSSAILAPGEQGVLGDNTIDIAKADLRKNTAWKRGEFYFRRDRFSEVLHQIALWYNVDVVMDDAFGDLMISGSIARDVPLSEVLRMLHYVTGLHFELEQRKLTIKSINQTH